MAIVDGISMEPMVGDPDDHRPATRWAVVVDPTSDGAAFVDDVTAIVERVGVSDRIPLHTHETSELVYVVDGSGTYTLGDERRAVGRGTAIFIPTGTPHALANDGGAALELIAVFPSGTIDITYLERNPAPGTEGDPPQPPIRIDPRTGSVTARDDRQSSL